MAYELTGGRAIQGLAVCLWTPARAGATYPLGLVIMCGWFHADHQLVTRSMSRMEPRRPSALVR
jgi:hypothetical protein